MPKPSDIYLSRKVTRSYGKSGYPKASQRINHWSSILFFFCSWTLQKRSFPVLHLFISSLSFSCSVQFSNSRFVTEIIKGLLIGICPLCKGYNPHASGMEPVLWELFPAHCNPLPILTWEFSEGIVRTELSHSLLMTLLLKSFKQEWTM